MAEASISIAGIKVIGCASNARDKSIRLIDSTHTDMYDVFDWLKQETLAGNSITIVDIHYIRSK
jgi:hypothetical protein